MTLKRPYSKTTALSKALARCLIVAAICYVMAAAAVAQQSPGLPALETFGLDENYVPPGGLLAEREVLMQERNTLREAFGRQKAQCSAVKENDSAKTVFCTTKKQQLTTALNLHIQKSQAFNDAVKRWRLAALRKGTFSLRGVFGKGEFYLITSDGRKISGEQAHSVPVDNAVRAVTGPTGKMQVILPDETIFTLGPNSNMILDPFVYDPSTSFQGTVATMSKGTLRFVTGKIASHDPSKMKIKIPVGDLGHRGTESECFVAPDGSGYVKLFSGQLSFVPAKGGAEVIIEPHQMISFSSKGEIKAPVRFE